MLTFRAASVEQNVSREAPALMQITGVSREHSGDKQDSLMSQETPESICASNLMSGSLPLRH
jgi:hypothetical protein